MDTSIKVQHIPHVTDKYNGKDLDYVDTYAKENMKFFEFAYESTVNEVKSFYKFMSGTKNTPYTRKVKAQSDQFNQAIQFFEQNNPDELAKCKELADLSVQKNKKKYHVANVTLTLYPHRNDGKKVIELKLCADDDDLTYVFDQNGSIIDHRGNYDTIKARIDQWDND